MVKKKSHGIRIIPVIIAVAIALLFLAQPLASQQGVNPATSTGQVTPIMTTNVTWNNFNSSMAPNEYLNSSNGINYLNGEPSVYNPNYISINTSDIKTPVLGPNKDIGTYWNSTIGTLNRNPAGVAVDNLATTGEISLTMNTSASASNSITDYQNLAFSTLPSNNLAYDYITYQYTLEGPNITGAQAVSMIGNNTGNQKTMEAIYPGQSAYVSINLATISKEGANINATTGWEPMFTLTVPKSTTAATFNLSVKGFAVTTYPLYIGQNATGNQVNMAIDNAHLSKFTPAVPMNITTGGYSESLSLPMAMANNYTETQASLTSGKYIEETTEQGIFQFPTAPGLTYGNSNMTLEMHGINATQVNLINVDGISYLSGLKGFNGTSYSITNVNPNSPNSVIIQVEYTATQWNSITTAPSFFSVQGIEYYWWIFIIGTLGAIGVFAGLKNYANGKAENLHAPPQTPKR